MVSPERLRRWLILGLVTAANPSRRREFLNHFESLEAGAGVPLEEWRRLGLLRHSEANDIFRAASVGSVRGGAPGAGDLDGWAEGQIGRARAMGARILSFEDPAYPDSLRQIPDPPPVIYVRGDPASVDRPSVAVVGARRATHYATSVAEKLAGALVAHGLAVVSGGARGVDAAAHRGALEAGGVTIAVMGSGLDVTYPEENKGLFETIAGSGAVLSEFPLGSPPDGSHFPIRNRLIAGVSLGTVVVAGTAKSGSMITATLAAEAGREVFAVPGPITSEVSEAPHRLILDGAKLVRGVEDILEELPREAVEGARTLPFGPSAGQEAEGGAPGEGSSADAGEHRALLNQLEVHQGRTADELASALGMSTGSLLAALMDLELRGLVAQLPGGLFVRRI